MSFVSSLCYPKIELLYDSSTQYFPNLIISTIVFMLAVGYANRILDGRCIAQSMTRSLPVFALWPIYCHGVLARR